MIVYVVTRVRAPREEYESDEVVGVAASLEAGQDVAASEAGPDFPLDWRDCGDHFAAGSDYIEFVVTPWIMRVS